MLSLVKKALSYFADLLERLDFTDLAKRYLPLILANLNDIRQRCWAALPKAPSLSYLTRPRSFSFLADR